jgi:hypothetical protein
MPRIYLDTNVFSNLRANSLPKFQQLNRLLDARKGRLSIYFSIAHIRDKRKDYSEHKFLDFDFMESLTADNYLAYHPVDRKTDFYIATPKMVYDDDCPEDEYSSIIDFFEPSENDDELMKSLKSLFSSIFQAMPTGVDPSVFQDLPDEQKKLISNFLPMKEGATMLDMIKSMTVFSEDLHTDGHLYKQLRTMVDQGLNNGLVTLNGEVDFNEALKDTELKQTFFDYVKSITYNKDKDNIPYYDFYQLAYNMLDVLGISKDKISKKNTLGNLQNDGMHAYFARYCDYFITDDKTTISKTKAMSNLLGISTSVLTVDEFNELLPDLVSAERDDWGMLKKKLLWDLNNSQRKEAESFGDSKIQRLAPNHRYLDFFDSVIEVTESNRHKIIAFKEVSNLLSSPSYSECQKIIEYALLAIGEDNEEKLFLDYHLQKEDIDLSRRWTSYKDFIIELDYQEELYGNYGLAFIFPKADTIRIGRWARMLILFQKLVTSIKPCRLLMRMRSNRRN